MGMLIVLVGLACLLGTLRGEQCPEGPSSCATGMTCCLLPSGGQGCCPYVNATCCADRVHCCPNGSTCDTESTGHCRNPLGFALEHFDQLKLTIVTTERQSLTNITKNTILSNVVCGDGFQCPDETTCCPMKDGHFGCCPLEDAVCCSDQEHCCPSGTQCDQAGYCHASTGTSKNRIQIHVKIDCPSGEAKCPEKNTCCLVGAEEWGCCEMENAVCCPDQETCCPHKYHCLTSGGCAED